MDTFLLRHASLSDLNRLRAISLQTFMDTFAAANTEENIRQYVEKAFSTEKLTAELSDPASEFYFAFLGEALIGYMKVNFGNAQSDLQDERSMELERIYVVKKYLGKAVGQALCDQAIAIARERNMQYIWLGVWEKNARAIAFYKKNGFMEFGTHVFMLGEDAQTDILMKLELGELKRESETLPH